MLTWLFSPSSSNKSLEQYYTTDEIMTSVLASPELIHSPGGQVLPGGPNISRGRLSKRPKTPTTPGNSSRPSTPYRPSSHHGSASLGSSEFVSANSSNISMMSSGHTRNSKSDQSTLPTPKISDFENKSLTGKRAEVDNMPLPPPIKITPLGQVVGGPFPPTPPGSHSSSGGESAMPIRTGSPSRFSEDISPPFAKEGKNSRPSSAGSLFSRAKSKERKVRDPDSFFGRDGELGDIGDQSPKKERKRLSKELKRHSQEFKRQSQDMSDRGSFLRGRSHTRSVSASGIGRSKLGPSSGSTTPTAPPKSAENDFPPRRESLLASNLISNRTLHHPEPPRTNGTESPQYLPPLKLPQLELELDSVVFTPTGRPSSSSGALAGVEKRITNPRKNSANSSGELHGNSNADSKQTLQEFKNEKKMQGQGAIPSLSWGENQGPLANDLNSSQGMYHDHLKEEKQVIPKQSPPNKAASFFGAEHIIQNALGRPPTTVADSKTHTNGGMRGTWNGSEKPYENSSPRRSGGVNVEQVFRDIENTKKGSHNEVNRGSRFAAVGGERTPAGMEVVSEIQQKRVDKGKGKELVHIQTVTQEVHELSATASPPQPSQADQVTPSPRQPRSATEHGFVFPFAQAVTVDKPVVLPSQNLHVHQVQQEGQSPNSIEQAINGAYRISTDTKNMQKETSYTVALKNNTTHGLGIAPGDINRVSTTAGGFVGGWKLDNLLSGGTRRFSRDVVATANPSNTYLSNGSADVDLQPPNMLRAGHTRKYSYSTVEGLALVEGGRTGNEVKLADMSVDDHHGPKSPLTPLTPTTRTEYIPFRAVTILPLTPATAAGPPAPQIPPSYQIVLGDGQASNPVSKPRSRAESPHWEPMIPVDRSKKDKKKGKRRWFASLRKDRDAGDQDLTALGPNLSNASSKSSNSTGSTASSGASSATTTTAYVSASGSEKSIAETVTPPSSSASQSSVHTAHTAKSGKTGSTLTPGPNGVADFAYTSQNLAAMAAAAHPSGPPHLVGKQNIQHKSSSVPVPAPPAVLPPMQLPPQRQQPQPLQQSRGRTRTRESGLRHEVRDSPSPTTPTTPPAMHEHSDSPSSSSSSVTTVAQRAMAAQKVIPAPSHQHKKRHSLPNGSASHGSSEAENQKNKPLGKLFVVCCNCEYWHDLPSQMYYEMHERGCTVKCVYCLHAMEVKCCAGYSCAVYVLEKHHGKV